MKPICFIAARGGSKGVKRKNIRNFAGKPLIAHTIESAKNLKYLATLLSLQKIMILQKLQKNLVQKFHSKDQKS